jgi:predicted alpha/beta-hydrolase family hydrolase
MEKRRRALGAVLLLAMLLPACGGGSAGPPGGSAPSPADTTPPPSPLDALLPFVGHSRAVSFPATDGVVLAGRLFGEGSVGVALAHMGGGGDNQTDWFRTAALLAGRGYRVLTFDRRGVCPKGSFGGCSDGPPSYGKHWMDVLGAVRFLQSVGSGTVIAGGASIGAMASLYAAERAPGEIAGVIWISGIRQSEDYSFRAADVRRIGTAKLFIAGKDDPSGAPEDARALYRWASQPKSLLIMSSDLHGTDLFRPESPVAAEASGALVRFLERFS